MTATIPRDSQRRISQLGKVAITFQQILNLHYYLFDLSYDFGNRTDFVSRC